jgi:hypothetical protein
MTRKDDRCEHCGAIQAGRPHCDICGVDDHGCHIMAFTIDCGYGTSRDGDTLHACSTECLLKLAEKLHEEELTEE